jgi:hypothetical protein
MTAQPPTIVAFPPAPAPVITLIMSAAYVGQELAAEFGYLPPSFLPVGTQRLYEYQRPRFPPGTEIHLALPESFVPSETDRARMAQLGLVPLALPDGLSLGEAVVFALNLVGGPDQPVTILHGDTLVDGVPAVASDSVGVATACEGYSWAEAAVEGDRIVGLETVHAGASRQKARPILCGVFAFAHGTALVRAMTRARGDFIHGLMLYGAEHRLRVHEVAAWHDFGHVQTFFRSRRMVASARSFNMLRIDGRVARKSSADSAKMQAEARWLAAVPPTIRIYAARLMQHGTDEQLGCFYETEYAYLPTLAELFVFATCGRGAWARMMEACEAFLAAAASIRDPSGAKSATARATGDAALATLVLAKTEARLRQFADQTGFPIDAPLWLDGRPLPSLTAMAADLAGYVDLNSGRAACVMHGDFCLSNILYDSRVQRIRVIDPRGFVAAGQPSIYGDLRYDMAKLVHSIIGRYDQIIAGRYHIPPGDGARFAINFEQAPHHAWLEEMLHAMTIDGLAMASREIHAISICLFLSMLPLHADRPDRQRAFIANALRLYARLDQSLERAA